jgi:hypothetical protein
MAGRALKALASKKNEKKLRRSAASWLAKGQRSLPSGLGSFPEWIFLLLLLFFVTRFVAQRSESSFLVCVDYISFCHDAYNNDNQRASSGSNYASIFSDFRLVTARRLASEEELTRRDADCAGRTTRRIWRESFRSQAA